MYIEKKLAFQPKKIDLSVVHRLSRVNGDLQESEDLGISSASPSSLYGDHMARSTLRNVTQS